MDDDNVDPRIFMCTYDSAPGQRISIRNVDSSIDSRMSARNSTNPKISRNISYQLSRNTSVNNEVPIKLIKLENCEEEMSPLQRKPSAKLKQLNHQKHSCTDVHCLIIFTCFIIAWVYIASYAFSQGNLSKVLTPTDSKNAKCGLDSGVRNKTKLFYFNLNKCLDPMTPITGCDTKQICVESCPKTTFVWKDSKTERAENFTGLKETLICDATFSKTELTNFKDVEKAIERGYCSGWYLKSISLFNHCVWDFSENVCSLFDIAPLKSKFTEFLKFTKSICAENQQRASTNVSLSIVKEKLELANSNFNQILTAIMSKFNLTGNEILAEHIATDLKNSWAVLVLGFVIHIFASLLFITLLRWLAGTLVWISICGVICGLTIALIYSFREYRFWSSEPHVNHHAAHLMAKVQNILETENVWFYATIVLGTLLIIILLIVLVIRKRIKIAVAIMKEASKAVTNVKSAIFFPIFPGLLYILVATISMIIMLYLSSIGDFSFIMVRMNNSRDNYVREECICTGPLVKPYNLGDNCNPALFEEFCHIDNDTSKPCVETSCSFNEIVKSPRTQWFMIFNIFGFLWATFFISAYQDMVLACIFSMWYWTFDKRSIPNSPLLKAVCITTFYHLGTLAFGSLILSICRMIRYVLEIIEKKAKMYNNTITRAILCCMRCFFWLLENFLRFLNRNAYIACAIHSTSFCESSRKAFNLITHNILRAYAVDKVSDFLLFLSRLLVTGCTSCITYYFLKSYPSVIPIHYPAVPVALVSIAAYIMTYFIFSTYSMAVDTLFLCFLEDSTENDGSAEKPFYMSKDLKKLLGKSQIKSKSLEK